MYYAEDHVCASVQQVSCWTCFECEDMTQISRQLSGVAVMVGNSSIRWHCVLQLLRQQTCLEESAGAYASSRLTIYTLWLVDIPSDIHNSKLNNTAAARTNGVFKTAPTCISQVLQVLDAIRKRSDKAAHPRPTCVENSASVYAASRLQQAHNTSRYQQTMYPNHSTMVSDPPV